MIAQVLQVMNHGQSVQKCVKEGMRDRTVGLANNPPYSACGGDPGEAPLVTSFVFNEAVGLCVHNHKSTS